MRGRKNPTKCRLTYPTIELGQESHYSAAFKIEQLCNLPGTHARHVAYSVICWLLSATQRDEEKRLQDSLFSDSKVLIINCKTSCVLIKISPGIHQQETGCDCRVQNFADSALSIICKVLLRSHFPPSSECSAALPCNSLACLRRERREIERCSGSVREPI
jgi:hypothetical protein